MRKLSRLLILSFTITGFVAQAATLTVTTTDNETPPAGSLSLKQALAQAQAGDTIAFNIPGTGPHVISTPDAGYNIITVNNLTIDGYTQPGSSPNSHPILSSNNARLQIIIDSSAGPNQRTPLGPLNNPGYGDGESAIFAVQAQNFSARGLCFRSRPTDESDSDPAIYCFALIDDAINAHISGCWFGVDPDGTTLSGGRASVANFKGNGGAAATGLVVGTDGDGVNDRAEFNVHVGMGLAIHLETPNVKVSGNFINILPDGKTIPDAGLVGEAIENGAGANMIIGTDGDGVADADERNIIGVVNYNVVAEFWRPGATNVVFAGNYVGVNTDASATAQSFSSLLNIRKQSSVRIGTDGDGVSDDIEGNYIAQLQGTSFIRWHGSNGDGGGVDAAKLVVRGNRFENNAFGALPFDDGTPVPYAVYYADYITDADTRVEFGPTLTNISGKLVGTIPPAATAYSAALIDFYVVDPYAWSNNIVHPKTKIGTIVDNGPGDLDPTVGSFAVSVRALSLLEGAPVTAAVTYSATATTTDAGASVTSPLALPVQVVPDLEVSLAPATSGTVVIGWKGGTGKYLIQKKVDLSAATWFNVVSTSDHSVTVPKDGDTGYFRIVGGYTGPDVIQMTAYMSGDAEKQATAVTTPAIGVGNFSMEGNNFNYLITYRGLMAAPTASHIHGPFDSQTSGGVMKAFNTPIGTNGYIIGTVTLSDTQRDQVLNGLGYANIHTTLYPSGEIRGQVLRTKYVATMTGAGERPNPVTTSGSGSAIVNVYGNELFYSVNWTDLSGTATAGHIHLPATADQSASPVVFYNSITGASGSSTGSQVVGQNVLGALADGKAYSNIHTAANPGGEIRGQFAPAN